MICKLAVCLALASAIGAMCESSGFLLGVDYSEWADSGATQMATDSSGALYMLSSGTSCAVSAPSCVIKLSAEGKTILWRNNLPFAVSRMTVDSGGSVYVVPTPSATDLSVYVAKLRPDGTGVAWKASTGFAMQVEITHPLIGLTVDSQGRIYVAATYEEPYKAVVVRLSADGSAVDYTLRLKGDVTSIAADGTGGAFVGGVMNGADFLAE